MVLRFELVLTSGAVLVRGEGRVVGFKADAFEGLGGLTLRFTRLDTRSKALVDKAAALREKRRPSTRPHVLDAGAERLPPPPPAPAETSSAAPSDPPSAPPLTAEAPPAAASATRVAGAEAAPGRRSPRRPRRSATLSSSGSARELAPSARTTSRTSSRRAVAPRTHLITGR